MITSEKFIGVDADLETSLFEYGLLVSIEPDNSGEYMCIYHVGGDNYDVSYITEDFLYEKMEETWFDKKQLLIDNTISEENFENNEFVFKLDCVLQYTNYMNIFDIAQYPFDKEQVIEFINKQ